jgi:hypothetical protein
MVMAWFKVLYKHLSGDAEKIYETLQGILPHNRY